MPPWLENSGAWLALFGGAIAVLGVFIQSRATDVANKEIARLTAQSAAKSEELAAYTTGTGSYVYLHIEGFGGKKPTAHIRHVGENPVRDIRIDIVDVTEQIPDIKAGRTNRYVTATAPRQTEQLTVIHPKWSRSFRSFPFEQEPADTYYAYLINLEAHNGVVQQHLQFAKVEGQWQQAYSITRPRPEEDKDEKVCSFADEQFPTRDAILSNNKAC